ncbi:MAG TPA: TylF/MycF/NovP-related O-methyltransferase [Ignavibacteriaceae bacterium]|nr:TylF/MycF/NovP-related O-methyltransferase [Ignavibacteriaceae bacterium]
MNFKLFVIRKIKALFSRLKLHIIFKPFENFFLNIAYLSKLSSWIADNPKGKFNDFYNKKVVYQDRFKLHEFVVKTEIDNTPVDYLEFGVASGIAIKWWIQKNTNPGSRFYGFDVFTGLPEDFGLMKKHHYDTGGHFPKIDDKRVNFIKGLFQDSLPGFVHNYNSQQRKVIHMDADLYSSTLFVLTRLLPIFKKDDIIIFDEFGVPTHEFRAFNDVVSSYKVNFEILGAVNNYLQIAIKIK